jgi:hypothetical protein
MYFTQLGEKGGKVIVESEYISARLIRKGDITSYYVVRCLAHRKDPTVINAICFLKQTIVKSQ